MSFPSRLLYTHCDSLQFSLTLHLNVLNSSRALCPRFSVCFSVLITSLGEEEASLCASRTIICSARVCFCPFSLPLGVKVCLPDFNTVLTFLWSENYFTFLPCKYAINMQVDDDGQFLDSIPSSKYLCAFRQCSRTKGQVTTVTNGCSIRNASSSQLISNSIPMPLLFKRRTLSLQNVTSPKALSSTCTSG